MLKTANKISFLVESQLPDFINEEYELFTRFVQKYYEQLEIQGNPLDIITNIQTYCDIDFYEKNILTQSTKLAGSLQSSDDTITVLDATSFPKNGGYIQIDNEICFYKQRTDTQFLEVSRGISGNTKLGDLYSESTFVTTQASNHLNGSVVQNISNLFLYALVKSFEKQYLSDFPEAYLKSDVDKRVLIKNITSFYQSKGTDSSIKFLFKCLIDNDLEPEVKYPRDFTLKASESKWTNVYSLKVKILSGNPLNLIGRTIKQNVDGSYASAVVDNVKYVGKFNGEDLYELILAEQSVNGSFSIASKTKLTKEVSQFDSIGDRINVFSTMGWDSKGEFYISSEKFTFEEKNVNQFIIKSRSGSLVHPIGSSVTYGANVSSNGISLLVYGVLYALENQYGSPYSNPGEILQISEPGFITTDPKIFDSQNNLRWITSSSPPGSSNHPSVSAAISKLNSNVSAIFEDGEGYYITSSGFPSHDIIPLTATIPQDIEDQKLLRIIRKNAISTTEIYETGNRDVGIAINGIPLLSYKDSDVVYNGAIQKIKVLNRGSGYQKGPYVLINNVSGLVRTKLAGQVVESIIVDDTGNYGQIPTVEITSGRNATATAVVTNGEITSIVVNNPGEYYSSPPEVKITDAAGKGRFADFKTIISNEGKVVGFEKIKGGSLYTQENVSVDLIAIGSGAEAVAEIKSWVKDKYKKFKSQLDSNNGYFFKNFVNTLGYGYAYYASPSALRSTDTGSSHSPIIGFAYDGNPIYGPYGYNNPLVLTSPIVRMTSSYSKNISRNIGPSTAIYPIGTFVDDYNYIEGYGSLDQNNGRYCVTPEYPQGTYAYFITVDASNNPVFPYIIGQNYYSLPLDSNYNSSISQDDLPVDANRLRTSGIDKNGDLSHAIIEDVNRGNVISATVLDSVNNFSVGSEVIINDTQTDGFGAKAEVSSVSGRQVLSIESEDSKVVLFDLVTTAYLFDGDTLTQALTGASGKIVGDVFSGTKVALRNVSGTFNSSDVLSSNTKVLSLILDQNSSYTKGAILSLSNGINAAVATGKVLEGTTAQNTVKVKVLSGNFIVSDTLFLTSSDLINTPGSKIVSLNSLSNDLIIFNLNDSVALLTTSDDHGVGLDEQITIDINPNDATTTSTYYVRTRIYQEATLQAPGVSRVLKDTGVGRVAILNGGENYTAGSYSNIALVGGNGTNAKATIVVSSQGSVTSVTISDKGFGYNKFDVLTVGNVALNKTNSTTPSLKLSVDHVGFSLQNSKLTLDSYIGITIGDYLKINDEIVKVLSRTNNTFVVERSQKGTTAVDHFDGAVVSIYDPGYNISPGYQLGSGSDDPIVLSYDPTTQKIVFVYNYSQTLTTISSLIKDSVFFDQSVDKRLVTISSITKPERYFEFSSNNINFVRNKVIDIKKYYKYNFDISHPSMSDVRFDLSPSINLNLVTPEKVSVGNIISVKVGFGPRISSNTYQNKVDIPFSKYFYYDKNNKINSEKSYLNVVDDPLQGKKIALYVTSNKIVYETLFAAPHDGSGQISYVSESIFSIGKINSVRITNIGSDYKKIPIVTGVVPSAEYAAVAECTIQDGRITGVVVTETGKNYSKPVVIVSGNAVLTAVADAGKITGILIKNSGTGYTEIPDIKIAESDIKCYLNSKNIGIPRNIKLINNGGAYHKDLTLKSSFRSNYILVVSDFATDAFIVGETIIQRSGNVEVARARVTSWRNGSNILIVDRVQGILREGKQIIGLSNNKTAKLQSIDYTQFSPIIKTYFDNMGYYQSDYGKISDANQRISDSYYYQDYSYTVKSKTPIDLWRSLIKQTTHPAGFQLFGEVLIESGAQNRMSANTKSTKTSIVQLWDPNKNKVTVINTKRKITQSIIATKSLNVEKGVGSVSVDSANTSEIRAKRVYLNAPFDGAFTDKGNLEGTTTFNIVDVNGNSVNPYNSQALIITLDGIIQEPGTAYTVSGDKITFKNPPLGQSIEDGQIAPGVRFYGRLFEFKNPTLNQRYLKKIRNIFQRNGRWIDSANQLEFNRAFIQAETLGYIKSKYPSLTWNTLGSKCSRDIGYIIDALAHDLRFGGNEKTILSIEKYFNFGTLSYIDGDEVDATIEAFGYAVRLCKLAMRNWDVVEPGASWTPGTNIIEIGDTRNVAIGMRISAGRAFSSDTIITEILDSTRLKLSKNAIPLSSSSAQTITTNTTPASSVDTTAAIIQIAPGIFLQISPGNYYAITPASGLTISDNAVVTFLWSGSNTGTYIDAADLIIANKINIQREAAYRIYEEFPGFIYPGVPEEAYRFKDARRLIYKNLDDIVLDTLVEIENEFGTQYATSSCERDLKIILVAIAEDVARGGNSATIEVTNAYFDFHDALDGERTESIHAFNFARDLCIAAVNNLGAVIDPNITSVPECSNVNSAITSLFSILTTAIQNNQKPNITKNTGITSWVKTEDLCLRDIGLFVDAVVYSLRYGGNEKVIKFANSYFVNNQRVHIAGELSESIYAYNQAALLMIDAMLNQISGITIIAPVTDPNVRLDTVSPLCAQVESAINTYAQIVEDTLEGGPDRIDVIPQNPNSTGYWTTLRSYSNIDLIRDIGLRYNTFTECEDVASALDSLYDVIRQTLVTGPGTVEVSYPDYINGENTIFDLYYSDGSPVQTDLNENLFVGLSGILQHDSAYYIDRSSIPNKIVFSSPPIWGQEENVKLVQEPLAVEKFFAHTIGNYIRCEIDKSGILDGSPGPFLILNSKDKKVKTIDDGNFVLVFIDGTLQREGDSYQINGPAITFTRDIFSENNIEIILLYGRDIEQTITLYDFERNTYYNKLILTCDAGSPNSFVDWETWYNTSYDKFQVAYQKISGTKRFIGNVKSYYKTSNKLVITLAGGNPQLVNSTIFFAAEDDFSDEYELVFTTNSITVVRDEENDYKMQRNSATWLYDTKEADISFYEKKRLLANLNAGDIIKIDGENQYRDIKELPQYVNPKNYNPSQDVSNDFFGSVVTSNYNGETTGVGLSVTCSIQAGKVNKITWNKKDLQLLYNTGIIQPTTAYGYETTPILHFIPVDQNGGGARAEVIVSRGQIIDIVITDSGSGYTKPPRVVTARQYDIIKQRGRKIDSFIQLTVGTQIIQQSPVATNLIVEFSRGIETVYSFITSVSPSSSANCVITLNREIDLSPLSVSKEVLYIRPASIGQVSSPTNQSDSYMLRQYYIDRTVESQPLLLATVERMFNHYVGFVDHRGLSFSTNLASGTLGPSFAQWENAKFMDTGNILSTGGTPVSAITIEDFIMNGFTVGDFDNYAGSNIISTGNLFNLAYPSINYYLSMVETDDIPAIGNPGYLATNAVIYANTSKFPSSGTILVGKEQISYTSKLSDRFLNCTRGVNGTPIEFHALGDYLRNAL